MDSQCIDKINPETLQDGDFVVMVLEQDRTKEDNYIPSTPILRTKSMKEAKMFLESLFIQQSKFMDVKWVDIPTGPKAFCVEHEDGSGIMWFINRGRVTVKDKP